MAKEASDRYTDTHTHVIKKRAGRRPALKRTRGAWDYNTVTKKQKEAQTDVGKVLQSHAPLVFLKAGLRPALFLITCVRMSVHLSESSVVMWLKREITILFKDGKRSLRQVHRHPHACDQKKSWPKASSQKD